MNIIEIPTREGMRLEVPDGQIGRFRLPYLEQVPVLYDDKLEVWWQERWHSIYFVDWDEAKEQILVRTMEPQTVVALAATTLCRWSKDEVERRSRAMRRKSSGGL